MEFKLDLRQGEFFQAEKRHYRKQKQKMQGESEKPKNPGIDKNKKLKNNRN